MKVFFKSLLGLTLLAVVVFVMGPTVDAPVIDKPLPELSIEINALPQWVKKQNDAFPNIKPGNESEIIFADSIPQKTKYAIVYLHGFSGSTADGGPVHKEVAAALGANIYLPRLYDHGLATEEGLANYTGEKSLDSAREALDVAHDESTRCTRTSVSDRGRCICGITRDFGDSTTSSHH